MTFHGQPGSGNGFDREGAARILHTAAAEDPAESADSPTTPNPLDEDETLDILEPEHRTPDKND